MIALENIRRSCRYLKCIQEKLIFSIRRKHNYDIEFSRTESNAGTLKADLTLLLGGDDKEKEWK